MARWRWIGLGLTALCVVAGLAFYLLYWKNPLLRTDYRSEFRHYFTNDPAKLRHLRGEGADWMDTFIVMNFELDEPLRYPNSPNLKHLEGDAARQFVTDKNCASALRPDSSVKVDYRLASNTTDGQFGDLPGSVGRMIVQNGNSYCVFVWEME